MFMKKRGQSNFIYFLDFVPRQPHNWGRNTHSQLIYTRWKRRSARYKEERDRQRQRDGDRQRQRHRDRDTQRDRDGDRETEAETDGKKGGTTDSGQERERKIDS